MYKSSISWLRICETSLWTLGLLFLLSVTSGCGGGGDAAGLGGPHVVGKTPEERGRYIVIMAGCNDCHTKGYFEAAGKVPETEWLKGNPVGWRGPWGTSYASNLRLAIEPYEMEKWARVMYDRNGRPPMPWYSLHAMNVDDLQAVYAYIKSLGGGGEMMPLFVKPGVEPNTPYIDYAAQSPKPDKPAGG